MWHWGHDASHTLRNTYHPTSCGNAYRKANWTQLHVDAGGILIQPTNEQSYTTTVSFYIIYTPTCFEITMTSSGSFTRQTSILTSTGDYICSHKYTLLALEIITSNRFLCFTKQRLNILKNFNNFNGFNFKNLCNLARYKRKTPWWWHINVETCSNIYYLKGYCCNIQLWFDWL